jgi:hypothetical protein
VRVQTIRQKSRFLALWILVPGALIFIGATLQVADRDTDFASSTLALSVRYGLVGCLIFFFIEGLSARLCWQELASGRESKRSESLALLSAMSAAFFVCIALAGTFVLLIPGTVYPRWPWHGVIFPPMRMPGSWHVPYTSAAADGLQFFAFLSLACGVLWWSASKLGGVPARKRGAAVSAPAMPEARITGRWERQEWILKWGLLAAVTAALGAQLVPARRWPLTWPQAGSAWELEAVFAKTAWVCTASACILTLLWLGSAIRIVWNRERRKIVSKPGVLIGSLLVVSGLSQIEQIVNVIRFFPHARLGEVWAICIGAGISLVGRSCLAGMRFGHAIAALVGGGGVALYLVVSLEAWFSTDVPILWSRGFLGAFLPGLVLLFLGFSSHRSAWYSE